MSLLKPILLTQAAFDSTNASTFTFSVPTGSDQVTQNRLTILNQSTGAQVYQATQTTFAYSHIVPSGTLTNGTYYSAYINTYNATGDISANSNIIQFYCYSTPTFVFSNIPTGNIIANSTFDFQVTYNQAESELLNSYEYFLYDTQNIEIANSGILYVGSTTATPTTLSYTFSGFADNTSYYVQAIGVTLGGTSISTTLTQISVQYTQPNVFAIVQLTENCNGGYVTVKSNLTDIEGTSNPSPPTYVQSDTAVDLTASGSWVQWGTGYSLTDNFTLQIWGSNFTTNSNVITLQNVNGDTIAINYNQGYYQGGSTLQVYCDCVVTSGTLIYYIYSNYINIPATTDTIQIWLRRIDNIYQLDIYNIT